MARDYIITKDLPKEDSNNSLWNFVNDFMDGNIFIDMTIYPDPKDEIPKD